MMANAGITDATRSNPMDVSSFVGALNSVGLSGFSNRGYVRRIPVPIMIRPAYGRYTMADLRRAGRR
jgi:hypothetical protein